MIKCLLLLLVGVAPYDAVGKLTPPDKDHGGSCVLVFVEGPRGLVVSNAHVCAESDTFDAHFGCEKRVAKTVAFYQEADLCFLVIDRPSVKPARLGVRDGNLVFTGYPHYDRCHLHWQHGLFLDETSALMMWKNMPVPGMSGGAVFDAEDGDLCGIVRAGDEGIGYGISDLMLMQCAGKLRDPETWIPDDSHVKLKTQWKYAKPSRRVITNVYNKDAPHWSE